MTAHRAASTRSARGRAAFRKRGEAARKLRSTRSVSTFGALCANSNSAGVGFNLHSCSSSESLRRNAWDKIKRRISIGRKRRKLSPCTLLAPPLSLHRMRLLIRRTALTLAAVGTLLWCSCERHHASELEPAQDTEHAEGKRPRENASPSSTRTPAQFFPTPAASPH